MEWASLHWQVLVLLTKSAFVCDVGFIYIYNDCFQYKDIHMHLYLISKENCNTVCGIDPVYTIQIHIGNHWNKKSTVVIEFPLCY